MDREELRAIEERAMADALATDHVVGAADDAARYAATLYVEYRRLRSEAVLASTTDARVWAAEFMEAVIGGATIDEELMAIWFANAMATAQAETMELAQSMAYPRTEAVPIDREPYDAQAEPGGPTTENVRL